eukprot:1997589-Rhodomonas_salina.1
MTADGWQVLPDGVPDGASAGGRNRERVRGAGVRGVRGGGVHPGQHQLCLPLPEVPAHRQRLPRQGSAGLLARAPRVCGCALGE